MSIKQHFTNKQARQFGDEFGCDWDRGCATVEQLTREILPTAKRKSAMVTDSWQDGFNRTLSLG